MKYGSRNVGILSFFSFCFLLAIMITMTTILSQQCGIDMRSMLLMLFIVPNYELQVNMVHSVVNECMCAR